MRHFSPVEVTLHQKIYGADDEDRILIIVAQLRLNPRDPGIRSLKVDFGACAFTVLTRSAFLSNPARLKSHDLLGFKELAGSIGQVWQLCWQPSGAPLQRP